MTDACLGAPCTRRCEPTYGSPASLQSVQEPLQRRRIEVGREQNPRPARENDLHPLAPRRRRHLHERQRRHRGCALPLASWRLRLGLGPLTPKRLEPPLPPAKRLLAYAQFPSELRRGEPARLPLPHPLRPSLLRRAFHGDASYATARENSGTRFVERVRSTIPTPTSTSTISRPR